MELPNKILEAIAFNTRPKIEKHMLIPMGKSTHEEHLSIPLQTNNKQFKRTMTILSGCNGICNVMNSNAKFCFAKSTTDKDGFIQRTIPQGAYEFELLNDEIKRNNFDECHLTEVD